MPAILAPWKAEIRKITVQGQPRQIIHELPISKIPQKNGLEVWLKCQSTCYASMKP
jgi:hypothetical protein